MLKTIPPPLTSGKATFVDREKGEKRIAGSLTRSIRVSP